MAKSAQYPNKHAVIKLDFPILVSGAEVDEIKMRRPTVRDRLLFEQEDGSEVEKELRFFARLCELDPDGEMLDLDEVDYIKLQEQYQAFRFPSGRGSSKKQ